MKVVFSGVSLSENQDKKIYFIRSIPVYPDSSILAYEMGIREDEKDNIYTFKCEFGEGYNQMNVSDFLEDYKLVKIYDYRNHGQHFFYVRKDCLNEIKTFYAYKLFSSIELRTLGLNL